MGGFKYFIMNSFSIILISYKTKNLVDIAIRSFEKHKPKDFTLNYYIVETSNDTSYKDFVEGLADNIKFISYPEAEVKQKQIDPVGGSFANGYGIELGKGYVEDDYTFICHSDVFVTSPSFFSLSPFHSLSISLKNFFFSYQKIHEYSTCRNLANHLEVKRCQCR